MCLDSAVFSPGPQGLIPVNSNLFVYIVNFDEKNF